MRATSALKPMVIMGKLDLEKYCQLIQKYKVTIAGLVPPVAVLLAKSPVVPRYDLTSLRMITYSATPLGKDHIDYGLSEGTAGLMYQSLKSLDAGATGRLAPHAMVKLVDEDDNEMDNDQPGELLLKGPYQMKGYINDENANEETFTADGRMRTGDMAKYDSKTGEFMIVDRKKEWIKYKGLQMTPAELESLLVGYGKVADSCVIGVYDSAQATELPRAYVVLSSGQPSNALAQELSDYITGKFINHKRLRGGIRCVEAIPKSPSGKILRRQVTEWIKNEEKGQAVVQFKAKL